MEYVIGGLVVAVTFEAIVIAWLLRCCARASEAWRGVKRLYDWINAVGFQEWIECVNETILANHQKDCGPGGDPNWPPGDPGDFPE